MTEVVLVTGAARGIGGAIASDLAGDHRVAATYHATPPDALLGAHPAVHAIRADLADPAAADRIIAEVMKAFGRLDVIVNNAGAIEMDDGKPALNHLVNVAAPMALLNAALPHLSRGARVINISSVNAQFPAGGAASYSASKAALNSWTRAMAKELGPRGIRVNGVAPGAIERVENPRPPELIKAFTDLTALGRHGVPEDVAKVVRFLASDAAGFITGETITVSGGYRL
ncbi:SDR family oxidoreductase [Sulfitobacter sp. PR48]|uniref:SDR family NAD(P)-dependent oxidoreductase n=1 Tax=Sulfitobacter sp. PR48 TaxID=3028383 RepID=UPI00237A4E98|nr:SDR family oxidoreductase [Sulfitobacter sp. PR48]MDD9722437.1 SDR family oxidoreductase [Sulfitobacter sp. PR48]